MKLALIVAFATLTAACASNNTNTTTDEEPTEQSEAAKPDDSPEVDPNPRRSSICSRR